MTQSGNRRSGWAWLRPKDKPRAGRNGQQGPCALPEGLPWGKHWTLLTNTTPTGTHVLTQGSRCVSTLSSVSAFNQNFTKVEAPGPGPSVLEWASPPRPSKRRPGCGGRAAAHTQTAAQRRPRSTAGQVQSRRATAPGGRETGWRQEGPTGSGGSGTFCALI